MDARHLISGVAAVSLVAASLLLTPPAIAADTNRCGGLTPTIVGTGADDVIHGTSGNDVIDGLAGNDVIYGMAGDDIICGGNGLDELHGGDGDDDLYGGNAIDTLYGDAGTDVLRGNGGRDVLRGGSQADVLHGGAHTDRLYGGGGDDLIYGNGGRDIIRAGFGDDTVYGGDGNDDILGDVGDDILVGDDGYDTADGDDGHDHCVVDAPIRCEDLDLNDAPTAADDYFATSENDLLVGDLFADNGAGPDADPNQDVLSVSTIDDTPLVDGTPSMLSSGATLTVYANGIFSYAAAPGHDAMTDECATQDTFAYTVTDPTGDTDLAIVTITVGGANDAPITGADEAATDEDNAVDIDVLANDVDPEEQDLSIISVDTSGAEGTVAMTADNILRYTPAAEFGLLTTGAEIEEEFTYTVTDGAGGIATGHVTVLVEGINDAPVAVDDVATTDEDRTVVIDVLANDSDPDVDDELSVDLATSPAHGTAVVTGPATIEYTPHADWNGSDSFTYTVDDNSGNQTVATVTVTVTPVNDAPTADDDAWAAVGGMMVLIPILANDVDPDGDTLMVTILAGPLNGSVVVLSNGVLAYTADASFTGSEVLTYQVADAENNIDTATVTITVSES